MKTISLKRLKNVYKGSVADAPLNLFISNKEKIMWQTAIYELIMSLSAAKKANVI